MLRSVRARLLLAVGLVVAAAVVSVGVVSSVLTRQELDRFFEVTVETPPHDIDGARIFVLQVLVWLVAIPIAMTGIGVPVAVLGSAFFAGFSWLDYPASRRGLGFGQKWQVARRHWALLTGFGFGFLLGLLIPFFNLLLVGPAGAVGAADLWLAAEKPTDGR